MLAVKYHHARPVLAGIIDVNIVEIFFCRFGLVIVLYQLNRFARIKHRNQLCYVFLTHHIAIGKYSHALVVNEVGRQKAAENEPITDVLVALLVKAQRVFSKRYEADRDGGFFQNALAKRVITDSFALVEANHKR